MANKAVEHGTCGVTGRERLELTSRGRWVISIVENDEWFDGDV